MRDMQGKQGRKLILTKNQGRGFGGLLKKKAFIKKVERRQFESAATISLGALENYLLVSRRDNFLPSPSPIKAAPAEHKDQHDDQNDKLGTAHGSITSFPL